MNRRNVVKVAVVLAIIVAVGLRVWWYWPEELYGGPHVEGMERRGRTYSVLIHQGSSLSDIVNLDVFEGYCPSRHDEFRERLLGDPVKTRKVNEDHHYWEYVGQHGRMQFHSAHDGNASFADWCEFLPSHLTVDSLLIQDVAVNLDLTKGEFTVYIMSEREHVCMTVIVKNRTVERIVWRDG